MSDSDSIKPAQQATDTVSPQKTSNTKTAESPKHLPLSSQAAPPTKSKGKTEHCRPDQTPRWKILLECGAVFVGIVVAIIYGLQLGRMVDANKLTQSTLQVSQRAFVTIGRKDGTIADFVVPKDPKQNAEIILFFQNSGHLPAKFVWGTMAGFLEAGSTNGSQIQYVHPYHGGLNRTSEGNSTGEQGESSIIAGDSIFISTLGVISQKGLAELPKNAPGIMILGMYEYCDELGDYFKRTFALRYRNNAPSNNLAFDLASDTPFPVFPYPHTVNGVKYLFPCETIAEREQNQQTPKEAKPWYRRIF